MEHANESRRGCSVFGILLLDSTIDSLAKRNKTLRNEAASDSLPEVSRKHAIRVIQAGG
ncbi:hypothetical protein [Exiguobacterium flavidum]|uniref:hypothetical protein n=1 Tax=Exiguobacterium flavidum TaxID=2184695 RepID=UPI001300397E|nr:hypothetical protein [Exiguobacterium flavidum]